MSKKRFSHPIVSRLNPHLFPLIIVVLLSIPAILPFFHPGFFLTDDAEWIIIRLSAFYVAFSDGQFPVRFLERLNFGYGYPAAEFLYPGPMYAGSFLHVLKFGFVNAVKILMLASLVGSALFTYLWLSKMFSRTASILGGLFALYLPYRLYDTYTRGSVGELFALLWVPFIFWMIEKRNIFMVSIGIFLLIISHNTVAMLALPIIGIYAYLRKWAIKEILLSMGFGFGLAAFFIIPILFELQFTVFSQTSVSNPLEYFASIALVGYASIGVLLLAGIEVLKKKKSIFRNVALLFTLLSLITVFLSTSASTFIWQIIPADFIQFPFRLLLYLLIAIPFLVAFVVSTLKGKLHYLAIGILTLLLFYSAYPFGAPKEYFDKGEGYYYTNDATTTVKDEYMPLWVKEKSYQRPEKKVELISGKGTIEIISSTNKQLVVKIKDAKKAVIQINTVFWPGWDAKINGEASEIAYTNPKGVMTVKIPDGNHELILSFNETPIRIFGNILSIVSFLLLLFVVKKSLNKKL